MAHKPGWDNLTEKEQSILLNFKKPDSERNRYPNPSWDTYDDCWRRAGVSKDEGLDLFGSLLRKRYLKYDRDLFMMKLSRKGERWLEDHVTARSSMLRT